MISYDTRVLTFKMFAGSWSVEYGDEASHEKFNLSENNEYFYGCILNAGSPHDISLRRINILSEKEDKVDNVLLLYFQDDKNDENNIKLVAYGLNTIVYRKARYDKPNREIINARTNKIDNVGYHTVTKREDMKDLRENPIIINLNQDYPELTRMFRAQRAFLDEPENKEKIDIYQKFKQEMIDRINHFSDELEIDLKPEEVLSSNTADYKSNLTTKPELITTASGIAVNKKSVISKKAIEKADYKCEFDESHKTFITTKNKYYMEGHHFIRCTVNICDDLYTKYGTNIDSIENIVSLCPNCHRMIHFGNSEEKKRIIELLYNKRLNDLKMIKSDITLNDIKIYYNIL